MLQQDYLMRLILQFVQGIRRSVDKGRHNPEEAADSLENVLSEALDIDAGIMLGLQPESFASILQVSGTDPHLVGYAVRSLALEAYYLKQAGLSAKAQLRLGQAQALARAYGIDEPQEGDIPCEEALEEWLEQESEALPEE